MTCIVGIVSKKKSIIGADSQGSAGDGCYTLKTSKVFKLGRYMIGVCGRLRTLSILMGATDPPKPCHGQKVDYAYMVKEFVPWLQGVMRKASFAHKEHEVEEMTESWLLVVVDGYIYSVACDYAVVERDMDYWAEGSGQKYALGSLYATSHIKSMGERAGEALRAADEFSAGVRGPFVYLEQKAVDIQE